MRKPRIINCIEDCFNCVGANNPFKADGNLSAEGSDALNTLREILVFMQEYGVITNFNEDKLDLLVSDPGY